jgi:hypothetical protein
VLTEVLTKDEHACLDGTAPTPAVHSYPRVSRRALREWEFGALALAWYASVTSQTTMASRSGRCDLIACLR